jgi:hypothetical protein
MVAAATGEQVRNALVVYADIPVSQPNWPCSSQSG